jgi:hypothetical protein
MYSDGSEDVKMSQYYEGLVPSMSQPSLLRRKVHHLNVRRRSSLKVASKFRIWFTTLDFRVVNGPKITLSGSIDLTAGHGFMRYRITTQIRHDVSSLRLHHCCQRDICK